MQGKLRRRSQLRAAVDSIVRSLVAPVSDRSRKSAPNFRIEPLEERQLLSGLTIAQENALPGSPVSAWNVAGGGDVNLNGFTTDISTNQGGTVSFKVDDKNSAAYSISIFRLGYYQGLGARQITTIASPTITAQPAPITDSTGLIDCGNWSVSASWSVPSDATSGLYVADLIRGGLPVSQIPFVVRDDTDGSAILYQTSDSTWEAYNSYGGNSLYESTTSNGLGPNDDGNTPRAFSVSYNRPFINRGETGGPQEGYIFGSEYPMIRFLEANGYDVSYATDVDSARFGSHLLDHQTILTSGHDEYWSPEQRNNMTAARDAGVNMALFSGNEGFWKTRWAASSDPSATPWRTIICYKETLADAKIDPTADFTGVWRDPRFPAYFTANPENAFNGTMSEVNGVRNDPLSVSFPDSLDRFWRNTSVASLTNGQTTTFPTGTLGYEWDEDVDNGFRPAGLIDLSHTTLDVSPKLALDYGGNYGNGTATNSATLYRASSGALVFSAGQTQWSWGLDSNHDRAGGAPQLAMQQATINLLADMGVQPTTVLGGLTLATQSTDTIAPTSTIAAPTPNATFTNGVPVTFSGTAADSGGGVVAGVEISTDGGATWHPAIGTTSWTYSWVPRVVGNVRIMSRATDDSGNIETPSVTRGVVVSSSGTFGVFLSTDAPQTPVTTSTAAATLGVRFTSDIGGQILGIRYFKGTTNTGTHIGSLWTNTGTLLATATFSGESASGWQQVNFSSPVTIQPNVTYVASYFAPNGHYYGDDNALGRNIDAGPLHLPADGTNGQVDGLYIQSASNSFPTLGSADTNFFVDVVFQPQAGDTTPPTVIAQSPAAGAASIPVSNVSVTFSESIEVPTLSFTLVGPGNLSIPATVSYSGATHTATLTPTGSLTPGAAYAVRVNANDLALNSMVAPYTWSFTTPQNYSIWTTSTTPTNPSKNVSGGIEVGVRFKSDVAGYISGLMFYKGSGNTGTHIGDLWTNTGTLLASATFSGETSTGWQTVSFGSPVAITSNTLYVASYFAPNGHYAIDTSYFTTARDNAPLHAPANGAGGFANGVSIATSTGGVFPTISASGSNFWVDVILSSGNIDSTPPIVASTAPANGATGLSLGIPVTATFDGPINPASLTFTLTGPGNTSVPATVSYNSATNTATLTPSGMLAAGTVYTASVIATDTSGNAMASPFTWSFTTVNVPAVVSRSPSIGGIGVAETTPILVTFNEAITTGSLVFTLKGPGNVTIPASVSYNATNFTATLQPSSALSSLTSYTVSVFAADQVGNPMPAPVTWSFTTAAVGTTFTIWPASAVPGNPVQNDTGKVELGTRFTTDSTGFITGVRFYKGSTANSGTHIGNLWSDTGTLLATATFAGETNSGWQQVLFSNPVAVTAGTTYVVSYFAPAGHYADDNGYFAISHDNAPLHAPADGANGEANGLYIYNATSKFPVNSVSSSNYWVDAVFMTVPQPNQVTGAAANGGPNQNLLSWSAATRAVTYNVYRGTSAGGEGTTPIASGLTTLSYVDIGLTPGITYFYKITALDPAGESVRSAEISATPIKATPVFTGITSPTIVYGTSTTTLSGVIAAGTQFPTGTVSITINGVTVNPTINPTTGAFSVAFDTHAILASTTPYSVTYTFAANANFNAASDTTHTLLVNRRTLNVTAIGVNRVYDGTTAATVTFSDDRVNGDALTITYSASFSNKNAANGKTVSVTGIAISGTAAANYTLASTTASATANITPLALTVSATGVSRIYNATTVATVNLSDNRLAGDSISLAYGTALFVAKNVGIGKAINVSGINVTGLDAGNYAWNATASTSADITPFALTVSATGVNKVYDSGTNATVTLSSNRFSGDSISLGYASATYGDKNVANAKPISVSGISGTGADVNNYTWNTTASAAANITPFALIVTPTAQNKTYDGTATASATISDNHFAGDDLTVSFTGASFANKNAGAGKTVTASGITFVGADAANYSCNSTATTTATIFKFAMTITASGTDRPYNGGVSDAVTFGDNRISGDVINVGAIATFADKNVGIGKPVGVTGINVTGTDAGNYAWNTTASTTASISTVALIVTATAANKVYDGTNSASIALGDNRASGDVLTINYGSATFSDKNVAAGKTVSVTGISVTGTDACNYTFNTTTSTTASITKLALLVTASGQNKTYDGTPSASVTLGDNRVAGDALSVTYATAVFSDKNVGINKSVSVSGISVTGADAGNYSWNETTTTTASITARALTVGAIGQNKTYDGNAVATVTLTDDHVSGDVLTTHYGSATFADKNAGIGKSVSVSGITITGADANNYTFNTTASATATITTRALAVTATAQSKPYDGTAVAVAALGDNRVSGDVLTIGYTSALFSDKNAASGKTVAVSGINVSGTDVGNYTWNTSTTTTATISTIALTVGAIGLNKVYDGTNTAHVTLADTRVSGDVLTVTCGSVTFADKNVGVGKTISVAGIVVSGTDASNYTFNTTTSTTASIMTRSLTVTATGQNRPYDQTTAATVTLGDNRVTGDLLTLGYGAATFADKNAGTAKSVSVSGITVTGADGGNYTFNSTASAAANITPIALTVTAAGQDKIYDGTSNAIVTLGDNRLPGDVLTLNDASATFANKNIGTTKPINVSGITVTGTDAINYTFNTTASASANITAFALTVSATGINRAYDGTTAATVTLGDNRFAGDVLLLSYSGATFADKNAGTSKPISVTGINVTGADAGNYTFNTTASATANITPAMLTISASASSKPYDQTTATTATLNDNRISGDLLNLAYGNAAFVDKNAGVNKTVTVSGITVTGADAGNYSFNAVATTTATITPIALTVSAIGSNKIYDGTPIATVTFSDNRLTGDVLSFGYGSATFTDKNVGNGKAVSVSGINATGADAINYTWNATSSTSANITPFALSVGAVGQNKPYDQTPTATVSLTDNRFGSDALTITYTTASFADKNAGNGKVVSVTGINVVGTDAANYTFNTSTTTTANITPIALTVTATAQNKSYDRSTAAAVTFGDNRLPGDVLTIGYGSAMFSDKNAAANKTVTVAGITLNGADGGNYVCNTTATTTASISTIALTVGATGQNKVYDGSLNATAVLNDNRLAGDALTITFARAAFPDKNVGVGKLITISGINVTGADAVDYTFNTGATTSANITPAPLTVSASALNRTYTGGTAATATLSDNRVAGDSLTLSFTGATFAEKNVGVGKTVTVTGINVIGADIANYTFNTAATTTANITPLALTVSAIGQNKAYDRSTTAAVTLSDNRVSGDVLTLGYTSASFSDKNAGVGKAVTVNGILVGGADAGNYTFNSSTTTTATITPIALTVSATGQNKIYDRTTTASVSPGDNRLPGDSLTITFGSASFADKNVGTNKPVTVSGIIVTGADALNYTYNTSTTTTASITPFALTVSATAPNKVYDRTTTSTANLSDNRLAGDALTLSYGSANFADKNVATGKIVTVSGIGVAGADAGNYSFNTAATTSANITPATLLVSATGQNRPYDHSTAATVTLGDNRFAGDALTLASTTASFADKNAGIGKAVSVSGISVTGADAGNYTFNTTTSTTATITPIALIVSATGQNKAYDRTTTATVTLSDNHLANDSLTLSYGSAAFADKNAGVNKPVSVIGINVAGPDALNYTFNTTASTTATITPIALTVTATGQTRVYDRTGGAAVTLSDNHLGSDSLTLSYTNAAFSDKNVGVNKPVSVTGITVGGTDAGNYTFNTSASTTGTITPYVLNVTAIGQTKVYDGTANAIVSLGDNHLFGDTISVNYTSALFANKNVGNVKSVTVSGFIIGGPDGPNYTSNATASAFGNITPFALTVGAIGQGKVYDGTTNGSVTLTDNRFSGDSLALTYATATFADKNAGTGKAMTVTGINVGGTDSINYTFNTTASTSTGTITPRSLTISATASNKPYDGLTTATAVLGTDDHLAGDSVTVSFSFASFSNKNVGNGKTVTLNGVTLGGADGGNYVPNPVTALANITPELVVTGTSSADVLRLILDADGTHVNWFLNGAAAFGELAANDPTGLTINAGAAGMTINVDHTNGNPLPGLLNLSGVFTVNGLQGTDPLAGTTLSINRSTVIVTYADAAHDPITGLRNDLHAGYNGGTWNGSSTVSAGAIRSANAAADGSQTTGIGYVDSSSGLIPGQPVNSIELKYTLYGDTALAGSVGFTDFMRMTQHYSQNSGAIWTQGDFDYDGSVGSTDFALLSKTYNMTLPAAVPDETPILMAAPVTDPGPVVSVVSVGSTPVADPAPVASSAPSSQPKTKTTKVAKKDKNPVKKAAPKKAQPAVKKGKI